MGRKFIDCREIPSDVKCSLAIVADSADEVVDAAVLHAVAVHKQKDTPELRDGIRAHDQGRFAAVLNPSLPAKATGARLPDGNLTPRRRDPSRRPGT